MLQNIITLAIYNLKILSRNKFNKKIKLKAWIPWIFGYFLILSISVIFNKYLVLIGIIQSLIIFSINNYTIENKSWIHSLAIFQFNLNLKKSLLINFYSSLLVQISIFIPIFIILSLLGLEIKNILLLCINIILTIGLGFILTELAYYDKKFKKWIFGLITLQIGFFTFFTSGAIDYNNFKINENYRFLQLLIHYNLEGYLLLIGMNLVLLIIVLFLYRSKYYYRSNASYD